jgi:hypothetical protein
MAVVLGVSVKDIINGSGDEDYSQTPSTRKGFATSHETGGA